MDLSISIGLWSDKNTPPTIFYELKGVKKVCLEDEEAEKPVPYDWRKGHSDISDIFNDICIPDKIISFDLSGFDKDFVSNIGTGKYVAIVLNTSSTSEYKTVVFPLVEIKRFEKNENKIMFKGICYSTFIQTETDRFCTNMALIKEGNSYKIDKRN
jgi:hypothetical protein